MKRKGKNAEQDCKFITFFKGLFFLDRLSVMFNMLSAHRLLPLIEGVLYFNRRLF